MQAGVGRWALQAGIGLKRLVLIALLVPVSQVKDGTAQESIRMFSLSSKIQRSGICPHCGLQSQWMANGKLKHHRPQTLNMFPDFFRYLDSPSVRCIAGLFTPLLIRDHQFPSTRLGTSANQHPNRTSPQPNTHHVLPIHVPYPITRFSQTYHSR